MKYLHCTLIALLSVSLCPAVAPAQTRELILGHGGQLLRALAGPYNELFTDDGDNATPVLAVETVASDGNTDRALVPGTDDARLETAPMLFQRPRADGFVLLWQSQADDGDAGVDFATFDGSEWSEVFSLEQDGAPASLTGELVIA